MENLLSIVASLLCHRRFVAQRRLCGMKERGLKEGGGMSLRLLWGGVGRTPCCFLHRGRSALQVSRHKTWSIRQRQNSIRLNGRRAIVCLLMYFHERLVLYPCLCSYTYVCMYVRLCSSVCLKTSTASNPGSDFIRSLLLGF